MKPIKKISTYTSLFLLLNSSCGAGISDTTKELSGGYVYRTDGNQRYIRADNTFKNSVYPNVVNFAFDENFILVLQSPSLDAFKVFLADELIGRYSILASIKDTTELQKGEYAFLKTNLLADSTLYRMLSKRLSPNNTSEDIKESQSIADSLIKSSPKYKLIFSRKLNYWIIRAQDGELLGPFSESEYLQKRKELGVPDKLKLENQ